MSRLTKHWSRLAIASSGVDGLVGCERLNAVVLWLLFGQFYVKLVHGVCDPEHRCLAAVTELAQSLSRQARK